MDKKNLYLFCFSGLFILLKFISISITEFNLYGDEAQYWLWSKDVSFGYFSKPPILPWIINIVTALFGSSFITLKSIPVISYIFTSYLVFIFVKKLYKNDSLAYFCSLTFFLLPAVSLSSFLLTTDVFLILFWTVGLIQVIKIKEKPSSINFLLLGIIVGVAFLSKYAAIYFVLCLFVLVLVDKKTRLIFLKLRLVLFFLGFSLLIIPNLFWNYKNNWLTFNHTADNISLNNINFNLIGMLEFLSSQILIVGPVLFFGFLFFYKKNKLGFEEKFLLCFSLPVLILITIESLLVRAHGNWAAVAYVSLSIFFVETVYKANKKIIFLNNYINLFLGLVLFLMIASSLPLSFFDRIRGLEGFVLFLEDKNKNSIKNFVISDRLIYANVSYVYKNKKIKIYSPLKPGSKVSHHFQLKNALPLDFSKDFILIGYTNDVDYLQAEKSVVLIGSKLFPFSKEKIKIYEVSFN